MKVCNASDKATTAKLDLSRFKSLKKVATKTVLTGKADQENNFDEQPIAPQTSTVKAQKKATIDVPAYSFTMLEYAL